MGVEKGVIKGLAELYPDLHDHLLNIYDHIQDIMIPFQKRWYYTKEMQGSYSIIQRTQAWTITILREFTMVVKPWILLPKCRRWKKMNWRNGESICFVTASWTLLPW